MKYKKGDYIIINLENVDAEHEKGTGVSRVL